MQASAEGCHLGNLGAGLLIEYREFCILVLSNRLRANNSIFSATIFIYTWVHFAFVVGKTPDSSRT